MQDNSKHNYDPELVDRGWSMLEKQLDEVLPQKPKRRFGWFWLPLLLGFSTLVGAGIYLTTQETANDILQRPTVNEQHEQVIAQLDNTRPADSMNKPRTTETATATSTTDDENLGGAFSRPDRLMEQTLSAVSPAGIVENTIDEPITPATGLSSFGVSDNAIAINENDIETSVFEKEENLAEPVVADASRVIAIAPFLKKTDLLLLDENAPSAELDKPTIQSKNRQNWRYYAEGQVTVALGKQAGLLGLAAGVERKLTKSWNLGFALAYERSEQRLSSDDISYSLSQAEADFISANNAPSAYNLTQAYQAVSYERIKGEFQANYQLHPRWRIGGGLSLAYYRQALFDIRQADDDLLGIEQGTGSPIGLDESERYNLFEDPVSIYEFDPSINAASGPYPFAPSRWQLAGVLSVQYQMSPHWAINMNYRHDLTEWQSTNTDFGTRSFAQFGLRYYFK